MLNRHLLDSLRRRSLIIAHEADGVGVTAMDPLYVFEGYTIDEPWVVVLAPLTTTNASRKSHPTRQTA